jgi:hypothetical protein
MIQDFERRYDRAFVRSDEVFYAECGCEVAHCAGHTSEMKVADPQVVSGTFVVEYDVDLSELSSEDDGVDSVLNDVVGAIEESSFSKSR